MPIVDLSAPITVSAPDAPCFARTSIEWVDHAAGAAEIEELFGVPARLLNRGEGWSRETFTYFGTHNSTHVDAPAHYNSVIGGRPAQPIDELPLEWFFAPGVGTRLLQPRRRRGNRLKRHRVRAERPRARPTRARNRPRAHRARCLLRRTRLHDSRTRGHRRSDAMAL